MFDFWFLKLTSKCSCCKVCTQTSTSITEIILVYKLWLYSSCIALRLYLFCLLSNRIHRLQISFSVIKYFSVPKQVDFCWSWSIIIKYQMQRTGCHSALECRQVILVMFFLFLQVRSCHSDIYSSSHYLKVKLFSRSLYKMLGICFFLLLPRVLLRNILTLETGTTSQKSHLTLGSLFLLYLSGILLSPLYY